MPYFDDLNTYLHQSSLLLQAYPSTRITTKYSLPRKPNPKHKSPSKRKSKLEAQAAASSEPTSTVIKREPSATLTLKTFEPDSGICLKYKTDKAAEVGRLMTGLGRLARGEVVEMPSATVVAADAEGGVDVADKMEVDPPAASAQVQTTAQASGGGGGGGGKGKKKKGKK